MFHNRTLRSNVDKEWVVPADVVMGMEIVVDDETDDGVIALSTVAEAELIAVFVGMIDDEVELPADVELSQIVGVAVDVEIPLTVDAANGDTAVKLVELAVDTENSEMVGVRVVAADDE
jgi:hypothetical protein